MGEEGPEDDTKDGGPDHPKPEEIEGAGYSHKRSLSEQLVGQTL